ncbi:hypothetical protein B0T25DRAFT_496879 [Lasiosphaeria hispida]|uniref:Zn(2)-C6 fungal-type domain-containing protein n=1 Tax=Lasiosphaeria hispida TaxID=260671 RepID=A0AAJ0HKL0_9PEZI|nr:hypothetical protein B0T25DRAFT_496879 [Lasiosphaeria hispida]
MVYNGPSKGCATCRTRRIKCDQARAACLNCCRRNTVCPGYDDVFERMHRDETFRVTKRNSQEGVSPRASLVSRKTLVFETANCPTAEANTQSGTAANDAFLPVPSAIPSDLESTALGFFFHHYGGADANRDIEATCSFFEFLPTMYARASVSSPLSRAIAAFGISVANLHSFRRGNATAACRFYVDAVAGTKRAIPDPTRSKSDELLMTTLVLEAYEGISSSFQHHRQLHAHAFGSIALLKHRGALNGRSELSLRMAVAVGGRLIRDAIGGMANLAAVRCLWEDIGVTKSRSPAVMADLLALELAQLECLRCSLGVLPLEGPRDAAGEVDPYPTILSKASDLASRCMQWRATLPRDWQSCAVPCCALAPSIQAAGVYSCPTSSNPHCNIYRNLSVANTLNRHRITELRNLALIQTSLAAIPDDHGRYYEVSPPFDLAKRAQLLVDEICASVPFFAGDVANFAALHARDAIRLPHMSLIPPSPASPDNVVTFPEDKARYTRQVVTSGMWMIHGTLVAALEIVAENQALGAVPREGQVLWIGNQISRLRAVFMLSY